MEKIKNNKVLKKLWVPSLILAWWAACIIFRLLLNVPAVLTDTLVFSFLLLVPGSLTLTNLPLQKLAPWGKLVVAGGFSIVELIVVGLIGNTILPHVGVSRPLDTIPVTLEVTLLVLSLLAVTVIRNDSIKLTPFKSFQNLFPTTLDRVLAFAPIIFIIL